MTLIVKKFVTQIGEMTKGKYFEKWFKSVYTV